MDPLSLVVGLVAGVVVGAGALILMGGGWGRLMQGVDVAKRAAKSPEFATKLQALINPPPPPPPPKPDGTALRLLVLLQREARLLDFFMEDISGAPDAQIGAGVREVHQKAAKVIKEHLTLEPVLPQAELATVTVPVGFDPSAIRLMGHLGGQPPYTGELRHPGWRCKSFKLPKPPEGQDEFILMPAEVEIPG